MRPFRRLFSPVKIGNVEIANRLCLLPMTTGYGEPDETVGGRMVAFYEERARWGPGLIVVPFAPVDTGSPMEPGIYDDRFIAGARLLTDRVHSHGPRIFAQLIISYHVKIRGVPEVVGPSPVWNGIMKCNPRPLTVGEIHGIVEEYGAAALRCREAGFNGVELLAGAGYLLNRFISKLGNNREDEYGGSPENRVRILLEIIGGIRARAGSDFPVTCRLNCDEQMEGGLRIDDCKFIARALERAGAAALTVYTGWHESPVPTVQAMLPKAAFIRLAEKLKGWVKIPVIASNRINDPVTAEAILAEGKADIVGMARAMLADPEFPAKAREGRLREIVPCLGCSECIGDAVFGYRDWGMPVSVSCSVNPRAGRERETQAAPPRVIKKVMVAGGGPGGMEAAIQAALRGHRVTLFEKGPETGGRLLVACLPPYKEAVKELIRSLRARAERAGVTIVLNSEVSASTLEREKPDALVMAIGADTLVPPISGISGAVLVEDILTGKTKASGRVLVIGGGMVGCETAEFLLESGGVTEVTIVEMLERVAENVSTTYRPFFLARLKKAGVKFETGARAVEMTPQGLRVEQRGATRFLEGDAVVLAAGYRKNEERNKTFIGKAPEVIFIGDCVEARTIREALREGFLLGRKI